MKVKENEETERGIEVRTKRNGVQGYGKIASDAALKFLKIEVFI